jgi:hypothetical protein
MAGAEKVQNRAMYRGLRRREAEKGMGQLSVIFI